MRRFKIIIVFLLLLVCSLNADELGPAEANSFSVIALPDTQYYTDKKPETFNAQTQWVVDNLETQKIVFATHLGDIVEQPLSVEEWAVASVAMQKLDGKVPYGMVVGNHDMVRIGEADSFKMLFGSRKYIFGNNDWYGGYLDDNMASFQTFEAEGLKFVIVHLPCNAPDYILKWADMVLEANADRRAIISTHMFLGLVKDKKHDPKTKKGVMEWKKCYEKYGNTPKQMWEKCFSKHKNVFLILSGDQSGVQALNIELKNVHDGTVYACMSDYKMMSGGKKQNGFLRIYRFLPEENQIKVMTYSVITKTMCKGTWASPEVSGHQFTLDYDMSVKR